MRHDCRNDHLHHFLLVHCSEVYTYPHLRQLAVWPRYRVEILGTGHILHGSHSIEHLLNGTYLRTAQPNLWIHQLRHQMDILHYCAFELTGIHMPTHPVLNVSCLL